MNTLTIGWMALPFLAGFTIFIIPQLDRYLATLTVVASAAFAAKIFLLESPLALQFIDSAGVTLFIDPVSAYFILTNALVTAAVIFYCWQTEKTAFFYAQMIILHGSLNAAFICTDFMSLYVALEVSGIAAALLVSYPRTNRSIWVALRYLFVSNIAMLFYLVGAVLVYKSSHSFSFEGLRGAPPEALALIFMALLTKAGIFVSGLWLPLTHSESETPVSALLSGIVVKAGAYPLVRCALILEEVSPIVQIFGVGAAIFGVSYAVFEKDTKRLLAFSTISQLGWIISAPEVAGFYALTHGLVKSSLFLMAGNLPSRDFQVLQTKPMNTALWIPLCLGGLSISGFPLFAGFEAKMLTLQNLVSWQSISMNLAAVGTVICFSKLIFLPHNFKADSKQPLRVGFWLAIALLLGGLMVANAVHYEVYTVANILKAIGIVAGGAVIYLAVIQRWVVNLPRMFEEFEHLVGVMSLISVLLFWFAWSWH
ncbi:cation:proton antiporter [Laspinema olomoucense]|uniref:cation:proton antiporter n=1 Tax=Laspinema olomoucense TaxID=3231600 RepID=UPI0021BAB0A4|nr:MULTISPECIES: cation:proton antiporter [unclassified Laspinema]MCT7975462.1 cation:proton antiporter [Laspinema sp. D3d]MCT7989188.1 cation:proton antiporter [Laspinema sp. D3a]MCT7993340.1 cation:proton antiporter [Laspinema sp. D3c]